MQHTHISAKSKLFNLKLNELWRYRELIWLFTKRSLVVTYKQTVLGPAWLILNPLLTSLMHMVLFGSIAKLSTDGVPQLLFYFSSNAIWTYFANCLTNCSSTFIQNAHLFGKVYYPRLVMPASYVLSNLIRFFIQMLLTVALLIWFAVHGQVQPHWSALAVIPLVLLVLGMLGMGFGIIISSLTTKYRDLNVLVSFGVSLWMYATPVVYPLSTTSGWLRSALLLNPVTAPVELFRKALLGAGTVSPGMMLYSLCAALSVLLLGAVIFNRVERTFMDTI